MSQTANAVPSQEVLEDSLRGWASWTIVAFFFFIDYCLKNSIGALSSLMMHDFNLTIDQYAKINSAFPLAYLFLQIPAGIMVDKYGPRWIITTAAVVCGIGCMLFAHATSYHMMVFGRALMGVGAAFSLVTCSKIATIWFPERRFAFLFGIMIMIAFSGAFIGIRSILPIINYFGWSRAMYLSAGLCFFLALAMAAVIRDTRDGSKYKMENDQTFIELLKEISVVMTSPQSWLLALFAGLMFIPTTVIAAYGPQVFVSKFQMSQSSTAELTSWLFMGWIVGSPLSGYLSDWLGKRKTVMFGSALFTFLLTSFLVFSATLTDLNIITLTFLIGLTSSGFALSFTVLKESYSKDLVGAAMGFMNTMNTLFEAGSIIVAGKIVILYEFFTYVKAPESFEASFYIIPVALMTSIIITPMIREKSSQA